MRKNASTPSTLEIHLLGPFRIFVDGQAIDERQFTRRKPKQLIKLLALQSHHQLHREQAMELLWPDSDPESAANNLHKAIHMARHALEPTLTGGADSQFILTKDQKVALGARENLWVDVSAFEQAAAKALKSGEREAHESAVSLYEGDLLVEDPYEDWIAARREQLRVQYQDLLLKLAELLESQRDYQNGVGRLKELLVSDPTNECAHRNLMRLYALLGSKQQALRQYELCREVLEKELGAVPESETRELQRAILSGHLVRPSMDRSRAVLEDTLNSLAILPFVNEGNDPNVEYLSDGITESIINNLSQLPQLKVLARGTVFRYKGKEADPKQVGRDLNVDAILMGRVLHVGDRLVVRAELINPADGSQLWGEQYNRTYSDIFAVQDEIATEITEKLRLKLSVVEKGRLGKRYTVDPEAYRLYLKGRYFWNRRTPEDLARSIRYLQRAIAIDSDYALAYVGLADSYTKCGDVGVAAMPPRAAFSKAKLAISQALERDNTLAEAHASLAHLNLHDYEWAESEREFKQAVAINPNYVTAHHWYAYLLLMLGREAEAFAEIALAMELDPLSLPVNADYGELLYFARRYDQAIEQFHRTLELDPHFYPAHLDLGHVYAQKGMYKEARAEIERARELAPDSTDALAALAHTSAQAGQEAKAAELLTELNEMAKSKYVSPYGLALVYAALGEPGKAFDWLKKATEEQAAWVIYLNVDPKLDCLRSDPRLEELARSIGLNR